MLIQTRLSELQTRFVITCGGLYSDRLAAMTGAPPDPRIVPFRGDYWVLRGERRQLARGLIYPVPDPSLPFLGVHFTKRYDGAVWAGPNAVLAFSREGYGRFDINLGDNLSLARDAGFWRMARKYWRTGFDELYRDYRKSAFLRAMQRYVPEVRSEDVEPGPSGVRAQALDSQGRLVDDFAISQNANAIHVRNAPSPAATSSLAIASMIADRADEAFSLAAV
jgi:L-2-hydroxyglutarate oxidase LhgO